VERRFRVESVKRKGEIDEIGDILAVFLYGDIAHIFTIMDEFRIERGILAFGPIDDCAIG
jgi:hypothetical protein